MAEGPYRKADEASSHIGSGALRRLEVEAKLRPAAVFNLALSSQDGLSTAPAAGDVGMHLLYEGMSSLAGGLTPSLSM